MAFLANPTARFQQYVSSVAYGGIAVGNDATGDGSTATPWLTVDAGITKVPSTVTGFSGITSAIRLNGDPASPTTYASTAGIVASGQYTIESAFPLGAVLAGNGATEVVLIANGCNVTLQDIILDPSLNTGGPAASCITIPSLFPVASFACTRVVFRNWTSRAINSSGSVRLNLTITDCIMNDGAGSTNNILLNSMVAGNVSISGTTSVMLSQSVGSGANILIIGGAGNTATCSISDCIVRTTLDPTLVGTDIHYNVRILNIPAIVVDGGTYEILGAPGARKGHCVIIDYNGANSISGSQVINCTGTNTTNGGSGFGIGLDSIGTTTSPTQASNCLVSGNTITGGAAAAAGGLHSIFLGFTSGSTASSNVVNNGGIAIVEKDNLNVTVANNTVNGWSSNALLVKGSTGSTVRDNSVHAASGTTGGGILIEWDDLSSTVSSNITVSGNTFAVEGATNALFVQLDNDGSTANTPTNNVYNLTAGSLNAAPWRWLGTTYATLAAWRAIEPTASGTAP